MARSPKHPKAVASFLRCVGTILGPKRGDYECMGEKARAIWLFVVWLGPTLTSGCSDGSGLRDEHIESDIRVVYPEGIPYDSLLAEHVRLILRDSRATPGFGESPPNADKVIVSFATKLQDGIDGSSVPRDWLITLPVEMATRWKPTKLRHVLQHEFAHVRLGNFLDHVDVPLWFREGFAEWAAGGISCEGQMRIHLDLLWRQLRNDRLPQLDDLGATGRSRLDYDYYTTFFEYLDERSRGGVADGRLLEAVKRGGVEIGLRQLLRLKMEAAVQGWQTYLRNRYQVLPKEFACEAAF